MLRYQRRLRERRQADPLYKSVQHLREAVDSMSRRLVSVEDDTARQDTALTELGSQLAELDGAVGRKPTANCSLTSSGIYPITIR